MIEDRRSAQRAPRILNIRHRLHKRKGKTVDAPWYVSMTENMSVNGILFKSAAPYLIGDIIELEVVLSGALNLFRGFARVVRVDKGKAGGGYPIAVTLIDLKKKVRKK